jgi:hypothetical protein
VWAIFAAGYRRGVRFHLAFAGAAFALTLVHEMFFFFTPSFVLLACLVARERTGGIPAREMWTNSFLVPAASGIAVFLVVRFSASLADPALCDRLVLLGAPTIACGGALDFHNATMQEAWAEFAGRFNQDTVLALGLIFPFVLVPLYLFLTANTIRGRQHQCGHSPVAAAADRRRRARHRIFEPAVRSGDRLGPMDLDPHDPVDDHLRDLFALQRDAPDQASLLTGNRCIAVAGLAVLAALFSWSFKYCCSSDYLTPLGPVDAVVRTWNDLGL